MASIRRLAAFCTALTVAAAIAGCAKAPETPKVTPKVAPPAIGTAGVLKAGVDLSQPPFAGVDDSRTAGIDVDVASAIAEQLGLEVQWVDVTPSEAATALADGTADIVLSVPYDDETLTQLTMAGPYITDAPAVFKNTDSTAVADVDLTLATIDEMPVAAQAESLSYWLVLHELGEENVQPTETLRDALSIADNKEAPLAAGDALISAYIARDFPLLHMVGIVGEPVALGVAVKSENTELEQAVGDALDTLAGGGVLDTIRAKWVGELPAIHASDETTSTDSGSSE